MTNLSIHPAVDQGIKPRDDDFSRGTLRCKCATRLVEVTITEQCSHNHLCGCTACWKPADAIFSQVAVVPKDSLSVTDNAKKLAIVNEAAAIQRHACKECGTHMYGRVIDPGHHYYGIHFIHPELSDDAGWAPAEFAGYVSSLIESGVGQDKLPAIRERLGELGLKAYDTLSPELMDVIAYHKRKITTSKRIKY